MQLPWALPWENPAQLAEAIEDKALEMQSVLRTEDYQDYPAQITELTLARTHLCEKRHPVPASVVEVLDMFAQVTH